MLSREITEKITIAHTKIFMFPSSMINKCGGEVIREERMRQRLSQGQLGEKIGITDRMIVKYEYGRVTLSILRLLQLCSSLGITPEQFMERLFARALAYSTMSGLKQPQITNKIGK